MQHLFTRALNAFFPPQCFCCAERVTTHGTLCLPCWEKIQFITSPLCGACGLPLPFAPQEGMLCGGCIEERPAYSAARTVFRFDDHSKTLIHQLKFQDELYLAKTFAIWLARCGAELIARSDVIVPVPLHRKRLIERRYNQSALLAQALSKSTGLPCIVNAILKTQNTPAQSGLSRKEREANVKRAFAVNPKSLNVLRGKSVLLVDDVMTTGATAGACTKALMEAGANTVNVLTLARVARD